MAIPQPPVVSADVAHLADHREPTDEEIAQKLGWPASKVKTVKNVANTIKDFLGFSEPKKGPLSNFHTYAPDMMKLFAQGIRDNEYLVTDQLKKSFGFDDFIGDGFGIGPGSRVSITQNIYSEAKTAADLMQEARWEAERAVMAGV